MQKNKDNFTGFQKKVNNLLLRVVERYQELSGVGRLTIIEFLSNSCCTLKSPLTFTCPYRKNTFVKWLLTEKQLLTLSEYKAEGEIWLTFYLNFIHPGNGNNKCSDVLLFMWWGVEMVVLILVICIDEKKNCVNRFHGGVWLNKGALLHTPFQACAI